MSDRRSSGANTIGRDKLRQLMDDVARLSRLSAAIQARPLTGRVRGSDAAVLGGTGFTVVRSSAGVYVVTFAVAFAVVPTVVACLSTTAGVVNAESVVQNPAVGGFTFQVYNPTLVGVDSDFNFVAHPTA